MPTVPVATQRVALQELPSARVATGAPSEAFGGPDLSAPTRLLAGIADQEREKADAVAINGAVVKAHDLKEQALYDPSTGALNQKGVNALGARQTVDETWRTGVSAIEQGLTNDRQKAAFRQHALSLYSDLSTRVESHAHQEFEKEDTATTTARVQQADKDAIDHASDPERLAFALQQKHAIVTDYWKRQGASPETIKAKADDAISGSHANLIEHLVDTEQDLSAQAYLDAHRSELTPKDLHDVSRLTEAGSRRATSRKLADEILAKHATLEDALAATDAIPDAQTADETERRLRSHFADQKAAILQKRAESFQAASKIVEQSGSFDKVPLSLRVEMSPEENDALQRRADRIAHPREYGDDATFFHLMNLASVSDESRKQFMQEDIPSIKGLSDTQRSRLLTLQRQISMKGGHGVTDTHVLREQESEERRTDHLAETAIRHQADALEGPAKEAKLAEAEAFRAANVAKRAAKYHGGSHAGLVVPGNIDVTNRPRVRNADGSISTVRSISVGIDGREVLLPTVSEDGKNLTEDQAVAQYKKTGKHLGIFSDAASATTYAKQLHDAQAAQLAGHGNGQVILGATPGYSAANPLGGLLTEAKRPTPGMLEDVRRKGIGYANYLRDQGYAIPANAHVVTEPKK